MEATGGTYELGSFFLFKMINRGRELVYFYDLVASVIPESVVSYL